jgi:hypothetical protein
MLGSIMVKQALQFLFLLFFIVSCNYHQKGESKIIKDSLISVDSNKLIIPVANADNSIEVFSKDRDTIFKKNNYVIIGSKDWKIDVIFDNLKHNTIKSKGDTLFDNYDKFSRFILLGDKLFKNEITILKKYKQFHDFPEYKVDSVFKGPFSKPDFKTNPKWKMYRTKITEGAVGKPNFAGHYWFCCWRCGSNCQQFVVVDCISGIICDGFQIMNLADFRPDSKMIIINNHDSSVMDNQYINYSGDGVLIGNIQTFIWDNNEFIRIE